MSMNLLTQMFEEAKKDDSPCIGIKVQMEGFNKPEIILNPTENLDKKLEYYKKAYNDDLELKANNGIKIVAIAFGEVKDVVNGLKWE